MCLANIDKRMKISIHALREEGDLVLPAHPNVLVLFLSTPSARRATRARSCACMCDTISIHALREEGDQPAQQQR